MQGYFKVLSKQYDELNDRHERLVKLSKDITISSKRLIFNIHRISVEPPEVITAKTTHPLAQIHALWVRVIDELKGHDPYRFLRAISPGMQEYIEAVTFLEYTKNFRLLTKQEIEEDIRKSHPEGLTIHIPTNEYLLGVSDLTGELMRMCVNCVTIGKFEICNNIKYFLQTMYTKFQDLPDFGMLPVGMNSCRCHSSGRAI
eukprot:TRINITY_DN4112_c0_g1_i1.p1 TRINITY_DN4112_c0_g1~~TRINITY_DN4112_c0_g1_i1.p1  ORF type:complete len:201 (-),score=7.25 TRINITY_DN4112_c0_g1_i1:269-871(-)